MGYLNNFVIPYEGLSVGIHQFDFEITEKFFENIKYAELSNGKLRVDVNLIREGNMLTLEFSIHGSVEVQCDRCGDFFFHPVDTKEILFVKFGKEKVEENAEILIIPDKETHLELGHLIYEYIMLSLPLKRTHSSIEENGVNCNSEIIDKLTTHTESITEDPRWEKLKELKEGFNKE